VCVCVCARAHAHARACVCMYELQRRSWLVGDVAFRGLRQRHALIRTPIRRRTAAAEARAMQQPANHTCSAAAHPLARAHQLQEVLRHGLGAGVGTPVRVGVQDFCTHTAYEGSARISCPTHLHERSSARRCCGMALVLGGSWRASRPMCCSSTRLCSTLATSPSTTSAFCTGIWLPVAGMG